MYLDKLRELFLSIERKSDVKALLWHFCALPSVAYITLKLYLELLL